MTCIAVSSDFLDPGEREAVLAEYAPVFEKAGVSLLADRESAPSDPLVVFVVTGGTERRVMEFVREAGARSGGGGDASHVEASRPEASHRDAVLLVAYPGRNSLPASLEVVARLQQDGVPVRIVFLNGPDDVVGAARLRALLDQTAENASPPGDDEGQHWAGVRRLRPERRLSGRRIGLVGAPSDWLVASTPQADAVRGAWGADIVQIGMGVLADRADAAATSGRAAGEACDGPSLNHSASEAFAGSFRERASGIREPGDDDLRASADVYLALRSLVDDLHLDAVAVRCFDLVTGRGATGCLALSRLADEGVVAACEGDVVSALGMLWVRENLGQVSWMANPARVDTAKNSVVLAHCTVPGCMVSDYALRSHFESGLGAAVQGSILDGPVTLLRIGGRRLDELWVAEGDVVSRGADESMCRTQVEVKLREPAKRSGAFDVCSPVVDLSGERPVYRPSAEAARVSDLLERPLGNHLILTMGWVADAICTGP